MLCNYLQNVAAITYIFVLQLSTFLFYNKQWADYELLRYELEEANEVCHGNWIEIQHQREYIVQLQELLTRHGIAVPPEY